jgi:hypothetical protein
MDLAQRFHSQAHAANLLAMIYRILMGQDLGKIDISVGIPALYLWMILMVLAPSSKIRCYGQGVM